MGKLIEFYEDEFFELAREEVKKDVLNHIKVCNEKSEFPPALLIDNYVWQTYKDRVKNPFELSGMVLNILKSEGAIKEIKKGDSPRGYIVVND